MLVIRFSRVGKKNYAQYRLVLAEKSYPIQGKFIEHLGSYDPHQKKAKVDKERINYWLEKGAQCSDSVHNLLIREGVIKGEKRVLKIGKKKKSGEGEEVEGEEKKEEVKESVDERSEDIKKEDKKVEEKVENEKSEVSKLVENKEEKK